MNAIKTSSTKGNCSIFHSDIWSSRTRSLKITSKIFFHISKGLIRHAFKRKTKQNKTKKPTKQKINKKGWQVEL